MTDRSGSNRAGAILPDFLVIGAMKAGTTTCYEDLRSDPRIFLPEKELDYLGRSDVDIARYSKLFARAQPGQVIGEVSATYARLPRTSGLTDRVARIIGDNLRIVYLVRNPVDRTVSHHFHRLARNLTDPSVDVAVRDDPCLIDYSRYGMQIQPWVDLVGVQNVFLMQFERYVQDRAVVLRDLGQVLGVPDLGSTADLTSVHNRGSGRALSVTRAGRLSGSRIYREHLRLHIPQPVRRRLGRSLLPAARQRPAPPSEQTVDLILERTTADCSRLVEIFGAAAPTWDTDATRARYRDLRLRHRSPEQ